MSPDERAELFRRTMQIRPRPGPGHAVLGDFRSADRHGNSPTWRASLGGYPMVTAPYVSEVTDEQIVEYFRWIAPSAKNGLVVYNAPGIGITLSARLIERLSRDRKCRGAQAGRSQSDDD